MRCVTGILLITLLSMAGIETARAAACANDFKTQVAANGECLLIDVYGETAERTALLVFLHGDTRHVADYFSGMASSFALKGVIGVALIRPGYSDSAGNFSTGQNNIRGGDYGSEAEAAAVKALKDHYKAEYVVLAGRSGGAAVAGVIIGKYPGLVDAVVLGACPCDVGAWRQHRNKDGYILSPSPHEYADDMAKSAKVIAITGSDDDNTPAHLSRDYVIELKENGIDATFYEIPHTGHSGIHSTDEFVYSLVGLLAGGSYGSFELPYPATSLDINTAAQCLIKEWGEYAAPETIKKATVMGLGGDSKSQEFWLRVRSRIEELLLTTSSSVETVMAQDCSQIVPKSDPEKEDKSTTNLSNQSNIDVCNGLKYGSPVFVEEAKKRGLTEADCSKL